MQPTVTLLNERAHDLLAVLLLGQFGQLEALHRRVAHDPVLEPSEASTRVQRHLIVLY